ncbi:hypothetical protein ACWD6R_21690 [Streptomyces sp. NPDC005151]
MEERSPAVDSGDPFTVPGTRRTTEERVASRHGGQLLQAMLGIGQAVATEGSGLVSGGRWAIRHACRNVTVPDGWPANWAGESGAGGSFSA